MATINPRKDRDGNLIGYQSIVRRRGFPSQSKTFDTFREAEIWAATIESEIGRGAFVDRTSSTSTTLKELLERYRTEITPLKRGAAQGAAQEIHKFTALLDHTISRLKVSDITGPAIAKYRDDRLAVGRAPATVNRELNLLSHVFTIAQKEWGIHFGQGNPVALIRRPIGDHKRDRRLSPDEEVKLLEAAHRVESDPGAIRIADLIVIAIDTAMRRGEIMKIEWKHVNLTARTIHIPHTKTDQPRTIPLTLRARDTLAALPGERIGPIWGMVHEASISRAFAKAARRAGLEDLRFHDLRHEAVSRLFENTDLDAMEISRISGHKTFAMLSRYTHLRADRLVARLDGARRGGGG
ncbi:MAG: site-specific integrase [Acidiphilium sp.]|nr:site-specific integrase [Acidiphilium sp.]